MRKVVRAIALLLSACKAMEHADAESPPAVGEPFRIVGVAGGNPVEGSRSPAYRKAKVTVTLPDDVPRPAGATVYLTTAVEGSVQTTGPGALFTIVEGPGNNKSSGRGRVTSHAFSCPKPPERCTTTFDVTLVFSGAAAGEEGRVSWQATGHASVYGHGLTPLKPPDVALALSPPDRGSAE